MIERTCKFCGKQFIVLNKRRQPRIYCSLKCCRLADNKRSAEKNKRFRTKKEKEGKCLCCFINPRVPGQTACEKCLRRWVELNKISRKLKKLLKKQESEK